jgi:hypothetical protein
MARIINPAKNQLTRLRQPLTAGEEKVFTWLDHNLHPDWEIYIQPHLNGLRPDFVILHPRAGVVVLEVKDWDFAAMRYRTSSADADGAPQLQVFTDVGWRSKEGANPIKSLAVYRDEIQQLYCPHLDGQNAHKIVSCAAIMTVATRAASLALLKPSIDHFFRRNSEYPMNCALLGADDLENPNFGEVLRVAIKTRETGMSEEVASDLRHWLIEPEYSAEQREPIPLTTSQRRFVTERTDTGYRRVKGPAGSGKSMVISARAATLLGQDKEVLVVTYNITLLNYLQDLAVRWPLPPALHARKHIVWLNFHSWCRRLCYTSGKIAAYRQIWTKYLEPREQPADGVEGPEIDLEDLLNDQIAELISLVIQRHPESVQKYDAILIDEGQDFLPLWISILRQCLRPGGEILLVADKSQDIYGTARFLTDETMARCGFSGKWAQLEISHRMPAELIPLLRKFAQDYLPSETRDLPVSDHNQTDFDPLLETCILRWVQTGAGQTSSVALGEIKKLAQTKDNEELPISDITVLAPNQRAGLSLARALEAERIGVLHTFNPEDKRDSRRRKIRFFKGAALVKATTIHSFKGLESRALVICLDATSPHGIQANDLALFYTALTRLKHTPRGAYLTVVCGVRELAAFGRLWPNCVS